MEIVVRAAVTYLVLVVLLRITTKRISRTMTPLEMVILFLFGGVTIQSVLGDDRSMTGALLAVLTICALHVAVSILRLYWKPIGMVAEGTPVIVYHDGVWEDVKLRRMRSTSETSWPRSARRA